MGLATALRRSGYSHHLTPAGAQRHARRPPPRLGGCPDVVSRERSDAPGTDRTPRGNGRARRRSPRGGGRAGGAVLRGRSWRRRPGVGRVTRLGSSGPTSIGAPRLGVRLAGDARAAVREDLVDHGPWRAAGDETQHAVAARAREGVDLDELLQHRRPPSRCPPSGRRTCPTGRFTAFAVRSTGSRSRATGFCAQ